MTDYEKVMAILEKEYAAEFKCAEAAKKWMEKSINQVERIEWWEAYRDSRNRYNTIGRIMFLIRHEIEV